MSKSASVTAFLGTSLSSALLVVITFISGILIARSLGPEARGDYGTILMIAQTGAALGLLSFFEGAILVLRRDAQNPVAMLPTMIAVAFGLILFSGAAFFIVLGVFDISFKSVSEQIFSVFCLLVVLTNAISTLLSAVERSQMKFRLLNFSRLAGPLIFSLALAAAWILGLSDMATTTFLMLLLVSKLPFLLIWASKYTKHKFRSIKWPFAKEAFMTGLRLHPAVAITLVANQIDRLIAIGIWPMDQLGQYFVAFSAVGAGYSVVTSAMKTVLFPYFSGLHSKNRIAKIEQMVRLSIMASLLIVLVGSVILPYAVPFIYGAAYAPAAQFSVGLLLAMAIVPLQIIVLEANRSQGRGFIAAQMSMTTIGVMLLGYWVNGYNRPMELIIALGISNVASTAIGMWYLTKSGDIRFGRSLLPSIEDVRFVLSILRKTRNAK